MDTYLEHSGIKDMKWGRRRWQNEDGTLTEEGKVRYRKMRGKASQRRKAESAKKAKAEQRQREDRERKGVDVRELSDDQLAEMNKRRRLESDYYQTQLAYMENSSKYRAAMYNSGRSAFSKYAERFATKMVESLVDGASKKVSEAIIDSIFGNKSNDNKQKQSDNSQKQKQKQSDSKKDSEDRYTRKAQAYQAKTAYQEAKLERERLRERRRYEAAGKRWGDSVYALPPAKSNKK